MQARWVAQVFTGVSALPPTAEMQREIDSERIEASRSGRDPMRIELPSYMEEIAGLAGKPRLTRHPRLLVKLLSGPLAAKRYRLDGPGRLPGVEDDIANNRAVA